MSDSVDTISLRDDHPPTKSREARFQQRRSERDLVGGPQGPLPHLQLAVRLELIFATS